MIAPKQLHYNLLLLQQLYRNDTILLCIKSRPDTIVSIVFNACRLKNTFLKEVQ